MTKWFLLVFALFPVTNVLAQAPDTLWLRSYAGWPKTSEGWQVIETQDAGLALVGTIHQSGNDYSDVIVIKTNANGDTLWTRIYGDTLDDEGRSIKETSDQGFIIAGFTNSFGEGDTDIYLIKTDSLGNIIWTRILGDTLDQEARSIELTPDGGYILTGWSFTGDGREDIYIIKTDSLGNQEWSRTCGDFNYQRGWSIANTSDSGFVIAGWNDNNRSYSQLYVLKSNADGDTIWSQTFGNPASSEEARSIIETTDGYIMVGDSAGTDGYCDAVIIKLNQNGQPIWVYLVTNQYMANSVALTRAGNIIAAGFGFYESNYEAFVVKINSAGERLWVRVVHSPPFYYGDYYARSIIQTSDGGYVFTGKMGARNLPSILLVKLRSDENQNDVRPNVTLPSLVDLYPNYPNPFNAQTSITYSLSQTGPVTLAIYNLLGQRVAMLAEGRQEAGEHRVIWEAGACPSGVYFAKLEAGGETKNIKIVLMK